MAHTFTVSTVKAWPRTVTGGNKKRIVDVTVAGTYTNPGGDALSASALGVDTVLALIPLNYTGGYVPVYIHSTGKLEFLYSDSNGADGPKIEIPNGSGSIATKVYRFLVIGY